MLRIELTRQDEDELKESIRQVADELTELGYTIYSTYTKFEHDTYTGVLLRP